MFYVDSHCHVYSSSCDDIESYISEAKDAYVLKMINNSENIEVSKEVVELSNKYKGILYPAVGIHPEYVDNLEENYIEELEKLIIDNKVIAIGEIGLDYYYTKENREKQLMLFDNQLLLAEKYNLPVIIHSREATQDTIEVLKNHKVRGVIHSFSGSYETACIYLNMGFKLGINGVVTFKNSKLKDVLKRLSLNDILLETDSPYLSPEPFRGKINSSKNIKVIGEYIASLFDVNSNVIMEKTTKNACQIFDISSI